MQASGADVLVSAATPKFAAQIIRKIYDLDWKPMHLVTDVSISVGAVINPAGPERATGLIAASYLKDNADPQWDDDPGMNEWRAVHEEVHAGRRAVRLQLSLRLRRRRPRACRC